MLGLCRFLFRQKAAEKTLLTDVSAGYGQPNAAPGAYSRICDANLPLRSRF